MIFKTLEEIKGTEREVKSEDKKWVSNRLLLKKDGMGFSFHDTTVFSKTELSICFRHHLEAVYCIDGKGEIESVEEKKKYPIQPGTLYALDKHDKVILRAFTNLRLICVYNPPMTGGETHGDAVSNLS